MKRAPPDPGAASGKPDAAGVRETILSTASELFYREGVRAVGVDLIVARAGVAKTSLYRHFKTKDELIAAFLRREDEDFWRHWDGVAQRQQADAAAELDAHLRWIGARIARPSYRGCPQLNVAAEFPDADHPARVVATEHKNELRRRLKGIATRMGVRRPDELADQLWLVIDGAFMSASILGLVKEGPTRVLIATARALVAASRTGAHVDRHADRHADRRE
jgi:AcrR family transcriptional regulator